MHTGNDTVARRDSKVYIYVISQHLSISACSKVYKMVELLSKSGKELLNHWQKERYRVVAVLSYGIIIIIIFL